MTTPDLDAAAERVGQATHHCHAITEDWPPNGCAGCRAQRAAREELRTARAEGFREGQERRRELRAACEAAWDYLRCRVEREPVGEEIYAQLERALEVSDA